MGNPSPFDKVHRFFGANFAEYDGWELPKDYGDPAGEKSALDGGCVAFDLSSFGKIRIKGPGAEALVDMMLVKGQRPSKGEWQWVSVASGEGGPPEVIRIGRTDGSFILFTKPAGWQMVFSLAEEYAGREGAENVKVSDMTAKTGMLGFYGPQALSSIAQLLPFDVSELGEGGISTMSFFMMKIMLIRGSWVGGDGIEVLCPHVACGLAAGAFKKYHTRANIIPGGMECLMAAMAEALPAIGQ